MPRTTVLEVLACLDDEFAAVSSAFARGEYLLWLGSGISRDVVPNVPDMLLQLLDFLHTNTDFANNGCRFNIALNEVLDVAGVTGDLRAAIDIAMPVNMWPKLDHILDRMADKYADVLDVSVHDEPADFLVWTGIAAPTTYGSSDLQPDVEHLCVAILMLEGVVRSAATTNWDGLVEAAMAELTDDAGSTLKVIILASDVALPHRRAELLKFHGCAVRAKDDPTLYRGLLIARKSQISGWTTKPENQIMKSRLEYLMSSQPALVIGLSAQDANIHTMLHGASQNLVRAWPTNPPAVVFAEQKLSGHHKHMLKVTYGTEQPLNRDEIESTALLGAYAKPTLMGLVLFTVADKLCSLVDCVGEPALTQEDVGQIRADIRCLRDHVGQFAAPNARRFIEVVIARMTLTLSVFRTGKAAGQRSTLYEPLSIEPVAEARRDPNFPSGAMGRLALTTAVLGRGLSTGRWAIELGDVSHLSDGVFQVSSGGRTSKVFLVQNARALSELFDSADIDTDDRRVLIICAEAAQKPATRSPRSTFGPDGKSGCRQVDIESICTSVSSADEFFDAFGLEAAL